MKVRIFVEGGGDTREQQARCRRAFKQLLERAGIPSGKFSLTAAGSRDRAFKDFKRAHGEQVDNEFVAPLVDSEDPIKPGDGPWKHLQVRDKWQRPSDAGDDQVFFMTTSMETWIAIDRLILREDFGDCLRENALPSTFNLEQRPRKEVLDGLKLATRDCKRPYSKGDRSFKLLAQLNPEVLKELPSFSRIISILKELP